MIIGIEQSAQRFIRRSRTFVEHAEAQLVPSRKLDPHLAIVRRKLHGIRQKISDHLLDATWIDH